MDEPAATPTVRRLVGVYDADHTIRGELAYWIGARLGRAHCSLCDITHGLLRERSESRDSLAAGLARRLVVRERGRGDDARYAAANLNRCELLEAGRYPRARADLARLSDEENLRLSGLLWPEARRRWAETAYVAVERSGRGQKILFACDPFFRGYYEGSVRLLLNAIILGPGLGADAPIPW